MFLSLDLKHTRNVQRTIGEIPKKKVIANATKNLLDFEFSESSSNTLVEEALTFWLSSSLSP